MGEGNAPQRRKKCCKLRDYRVTRSFGTSGATLWSTAVHHHRRYTSTPELPVHRCANELSNPSMYTEEEGKEGLGVGNVQNVKVCMEGNTYTICIHRY